MNNYGYGILAGLNPLEHVVTRPLFSFDVWGVEIVVSNHMFMLTLSALCLMVFLPLAVRGKWMVRTGFGNMIETVCVFIRDEMARPFLGESTDKHIGFIWTIFFFVLTLNLMGMVPFGGIITLFTGRESHLEGAATANIYVVAALAITAFFTIHISGIRQQGFGGYIKNFAPKVPWPMVPFIYFMEIIGALVKPFSLAIRLFANIMAGHLLIATLLGLIFLFKNIYVAVGGVLMIVAMSFLELLVAFIQAYVFTLLSTVFISFAVQPEH